MGFGTCRPPPRARRAHSPFLFVPPSPLSSADRWLPRQPRLRHLLHRLLLHHYSCVLSHHLPPHPKAYASSCDSAVGSEGRRQSPTRTRRLGTGFGGCSGRSVSGRLVSQLSLFLLSRSEADLDVCDVDRWRQARRSGYVPSLLSSPLSSAR